MINIWIEYRAMFDFAQSYDNNVKLWKSKWKSIMEFAFVLKINS